MTISNRHDDERINHGIPEDQSVVAVLLVGYADKRADAVQHDFTVEAIGFAKGEIPYTGLYAFPADESLRQAAVQSAMEVAPEIHVFEGRVCTGDQFISSKEQKEAILSSFGGKCSDRSSHDCEQ